MTPLANNPPFYRLHHWAVIYYVNNRRLAAAAHLFQPRWAGHAAPFISWRENKKAAGLDIHGDSVCYAHALIAIILSRNNAGRY
ncbi:hypothetical protein SARI_04487 [Salmonella enterica subsp. arizonae serovar 62:z4,z23:-]|uniref:Uncharacterized protein n=1 Tax=Salmonella arizonae (strain ATCC BAA-731 / CDC346-86 / RSK2980) TaxID=41514 RepID=A9MQL7_SALAR|nr:hypothetical protein SARI_04487 [Salmonella enterica subsp. arizonae serovar 62:z4,z23:-]